MCQAEHRPRKVCKPEPRLGWYSLPLQPRVRHDCVTLLPGKGTAVPATRSELTWWLLEPCPPSSSLAQQGGPGNQSG